MVKKLKKTKNKTLKGFPYNNLKPYLRALYSKQNKRKHIFLLKLAPQNILENGMDNILENPIYKKYLGKAFPRSIVELENNKTIFCANTFLDEVRWARYFLIKNLKTLNQYLSLKDKFEVNMAKGEYEIAEGLLEKIENEFGYSLWLLEHKLYLLQESKGIIAQKEYFKKICEETNQDFIINTLANYISAKNEPNYKMNSFRENLIDFIDRIPSDYADYLIFKLDFFQMEKSDSFTFILNKEFKFSLIDGYEALIKMLLYLASNNEDMDLVKDTINILKDVEDKKIIKLSNLLKKEIEYKKSETLDKIVHNFDLYEYGDYAKSIALSEELLLNDVLRGEIYEIYLISLIKLDKSIVNHDGILFETLKICKSLISSKDSLNDSYDKIQKILSINSSFSWPYVINSICKRFYEKHSIHNSDLFISQINMEFFNLKELSKWNEVPMLKKVYDSLLKEYSENLTLNLIKNFNDFNSEKIQELKIPEERKIRYLSEISYLKEDYNQVIIFLKDYLNKFDVYSYNMIISCYIKSLIKIGQVKLGLEYLVNTYFNCQNSYTSLPLNNISIEKMIKQEELRKEIIFPIAMSICDKYNNKKLEFELYISYEQYLLKNGESKPSKLSEKIISSNNDKRYLIYFLEEVCIIPIMSKSAFFDSTIELIDERIKILEKLIEINLKSSEKYVKEIYSLKESKNLKQVRNRIDRSKIYINEEGLKERMINKLDSTFERYKNLNDYDDEAEEKFISIPIDGISEKSLYLVGNNKKNLFSNMIGEARDVFTFDNKQGLDNCLSTEIRHGRIVNTLRAKFEKYHLITKKDEHNKYLPNNYWLEKYSPLLESILDKLSTILEKFSKKIDEYMNSIKDDLIQIKTEKTNAKGLFDYLIYVEDLKKWEKESIDMKNTEEFIEYMLGCFIKITKNNLLTVRSEMKSNIKTKFISILTELFNNLEHLLKMESSYLSDIKNEVLQCKIEVQNEIYNIAEWFELNEKNEMNDYDFNQILGLVMETIKNCTNTKITINLDINGKLFLKGWSSRGIFTILFNLLHNATQHSNLQETNCNLKIEVLDNDILFRIKNDFKCEKKKFESEILELNKKLCEKEILNVNKEGGTGFFKIKNILTNELNLKNEIFLEIEDEKYFVVNMKIERRILL